MAHESDDLPIGKLATITAAGCLIALTLSYLAIGAYYKVEAKHSAKHSQNIGAEAESLTDAQKNQLGDIDAVIEELATE